MEDLKNKQSRSNRHIENIPPNNKQQNTYPSQVHIKIFQERYYIGYKIGVSSWKQKISSRRKTGKSKNVWKLNNKLLTSGPKKKS